MENTKINISDSLTKVRDSGEFIYNETASQQNAIKEFFEHITKLITEYIKHFLKYFNVKLPNQFNDAGFIHFITTFLVWGSVIFIILCLIILLYTQLKKYKNTETEEFQEQFNILTGKIDSSAWLERAKKQALNNNYREACRSIYTSLLLYLDEKKIIKYDKTKTNLEYLNSLKTKKELYTPLKGIVKVFEVLWYGNNKGSETDFQECLKLYQEAVNE